MTVIQARPRGNTAGLPRCVDEASENGQIMGSVLHPCACLPDRAGLCRTSVVESVNRGAGSVPWTVDCEIATYRRRVDKLSHALQSAPDGSLHDARVCIARPFARIERSLDLSTTKATVTGASPRQR